MSWLNRDPVVAVIHLNGIITPRGGALHKGMSLENTAPLIERAFKQKRLKAIALSINSPGGSPVQSALIHKRIRALAKEKDIPVYAFAEDVAASGGYWLALAGDKIYADENSIIGSIGVISSGFGFTELLDKVGIERRVHTAGKNKAMLDPFRPEKKEDVARLKALHDDMHESFIAMVRSRRGKKLKGKDNVLFSGEFWTGKRAKKFGLIDELGDLRTVMREKFGDKVKLIAMTQRQSWLKRRLGFQSISGDKLAGEALASLEERAIWERFGL